jgi:UDP-hydrolysing UDP-N-acetyl-D-glucosamine 2-epimerase
MPRKICVVTGSRAEYGLLRWLMREIADDSGLQLQVAVTGMHLSEAFGSTWREIEADGFRIDARVEALESGDDEAAVARAIGRGVAGFSDALAKLRPDVMVLLGDRYEILAAGIAGLVHRVPMAHIHGGETTEGAIDEAIRHSLTKMCHLHFVAAEDYRKRVIQLGEDPTRVFNVGAPGVDAIARLEPIGREGLERDLGFRFRKTNFLVTYHPATLVDRDPRDAMADLFRALDQFPDAGVILTKSNADAGGRALNELVDAYAARNPGRVVAHVSLGARRYLSTIRQVDAVVGNSSSGIIEAPALRVPTVNIGDRQKGRLMPASVLAAEENPDAIAAALRHALDPAFRAGLATMRAMYGEGQASRAIKDKLKSVAFAGLLRKRFHDLGGQP